MSKALKTQDKVVKGGDVVRIPRKLKKLNKKNFGIVSFDEKEA